MENQIIPAGFPIYVDGQAEGAYENTPVFSALVLGWQVSNYGKSWLPSVAPSNDNGLKAPAMLREWRIVSES